MYFAGRELGSVKPWGDVSTAWLYALNHLPSLPDAYLKHFHGAKEKFDSEQFVNDDFLIKRCCKLSCLHLVFILASRYLFLFFLLVAVAGAPLRALIKKAPKMMSDTIMALLAQRGATSLAARAPESAGEKGDEETSRLSKPIPTIVHVEPDSSADPPSTEVVDLSHDKEKKRHRKGGDEASHSHRKKSKSSSRSKSSDVVKPPKIPTTGSFPQAVTTAKNRLDQVCKFICPLLFLLSFLTGVALVICFSFDFVFIVLSPSS